MAHQFETLLYKFVEQPEIKTGAMQELLVEMGKQQQMANQQERKKISSQKLKNIKRKRLSINKEN